MLIIVYSSSPWKLGVLGVQNGSCIENKIIFWALLWKILKN